MKKILPLTASFACILFSLNAQNDSLERSIQIGYYTDYNCAIKESQGQKFYLGFASSDSLGGVEHPYIMRLDDDGTTLWQRSAFDTLYESGVISRLLQVYDDNIVLTGYEQMCDVSMGNGYVQKVSRISGNTIWLKTYSFTYGKGFGNDIVQLPDSGFFVANKTMLYRLNSTGDSIASKSYGFGRIFELEITPANYILIGCDFGVIKIDTAGNVIDTLSLSKDIRHIATQGDSLYFFDSEKTIYKTDSSLTVLGIDTTLEFCASSNAMVVSNNHLWLLVHLPNGVSKLFKRDFNFGSWGQHAFSYLNGADLDVRDMLVNLHSFELFIHEHTNNISNHVLLKNWINSTDTTYYYNTDVGVTGFHSDSSYATISYAGGQTIVHPGFDIYVNVKNYGQVPVTEVFLNSLVDTSISYCQPYAYGNKFSGLNIMPGDSADIHLGWFSAAAYDSASNPTNECNICLWTSSPNSRMDYDHGNDNNCKALVPANLAVINELHESDVFSFYPNPAGNELTIKMNGTAGLNNSTVSVSDLLGKIILKKVIKSRDAKLNVSKLTPGIYVAKIETGTNVFTQKFVKQ